MMSNIHQNILDKFSVTISPNLSPILNSEREIVEAIQESQALQQISCSGEQKYISHEEFLKYYNEMRSISVSQMDVNTVSVDDKNSISRNSGGTVENCTVIGNGLIVINENQVDIDDMAYSSNRSERSAIRVAEGLKCCACNSNVHQLNNALLFFQI